jgi:hypothetical protein
MNGNLSRTLSACALVFTLLVTASCDRASAVSVGWGRGSRLYAGTDSMGAAPEQLSAIPIRSRDLPENSAAAMSHTQPGVLFTINDSGNDPVLFALDTTGALRGEWRIRGAKNVDWESAAVGPCQPGTLPSCVYIGDTGDNEALHSMRSIYRVNEPAATSARIIGSLPAERLDYAYPDGPRDVEAMYVAPNGDLFLISKRPSTDAAGRLRNALVYRLAAQRWGAGGRVTAERVDSLDIVPGSAPLRTITDAALSPDGRHLAVRTYMQLYVFATDSATGRVDHAVAPSVCNLVSVDEAQGEGVTWADSKGRLVLTSEGRDSPLDLVTCPLPR